MYYFEVEMMGKWRPRTSADPPRTKSVGGVERLRTGEGTQFPIRHLRRVPAEMVELRLDQLELRRDELEAVR